jgi:2-methylisocitrate lyase-like PEP mutase family enzyme
VAAFADAGADILFVDALESEDEMRAFCRVNADIPKVN